MDDKVNQNHKGFKIFILLLLIGTIFFLNKGNQVKLIEAYKSFSVKDKSLDKIKSIEVSQDIEKIALFNKNICLLNGGKLSIIDIDNNLILEKDFNFESPHIVHGESFSYIMDKTRGDIYIINKDGETLERISLDKTIYNFKDNKENILIHTKSHEEEAIIILDNKGVFHRIHLVEDMNILTYHADKKGEKYIISNLLLNDALKSEIYTYSISGEVESKSIIDNKIVIFTEIINDEVIALTDKCLYSMRDENIYWEKSLSNVKDILVKDNEIYILYGDNLEIINLEGRTMEKLLLTEKVKQITHHDDLIIVWGESDLLGIQGNQEILKYKHEGIIKDILINDNYLGIVDMDNIHLFEINNK